VRRTERDRRRRDLGQNFLVDQHVVGRLIDGLDVRADELIVDIGAGTGALTLPLVRAGAEVWAVEPDVVWAQRLQDAADGAGYGESVRVVRCEFQELRLPRRPFRVVANPPFSLTTDLMAHLFDRPVSGPTRADLIVQLEVASKYATIPPTSLRSSAWAPWWQFEMGPRIDRRAFRPRPSVDAAVLSVRRRDPAILPEWLAPRLRDLLRPAWGS
jgi:23S rRNA (adenine-N6)-dimethyltransferase